MKYLIAGLLLFVVSLTAQPVHASESMIIDSFDYPDEIDVRRAWRPAQDSPPVSLAARDGGQALQMNADFTGDLRRVVYDKDVKLDLSKWGRFTLDLRVDEPRVFSTFTLYFRSGAGWYAATGTMPGKRWGTVHFPRSAFRTEGNPAGWDKIDGIRISAWRGGSFTGTCLVDNLVAHRETICLVLGSGDDAAIQQSADTISTLLRQIGIMTSTITAADVVRGGLQDMKLAIFPYNPSMQLEEVLEVIRFVREGGKILVFYSLPFGLDDLLGIRRTGWKRQDFPQQYSQIRFDAPDITGMPTQVAQASWNITLVEPIRDKARIIGEWYDNQGGKSGAPAMTISENGAFMSHIVLSDDPSGKQRMLVALLGHFLPEIWPTVAQKALAGPSQIGHLAEGAAAVDEWVKVQAPFSAQHDASERLLATAEESLEAARKAYEEHRYPEAVELASTAWDQKTRAYVLSHPSREVEFRGSWNHSGTGAYETWEESVRNLKENGFNAVLPNMLWGGLALYDSEHLPHHPVVAERGDQIAECVDAARRHGLEVHVWKVNWRLGNTPAHFQQRMRNEGRLARHFNGQELDWLCPSDPRNLRLELDTLLEVVTKYDVDGIHFDYIRYSDNNACFCDGCRERFQRDTGIAVTNWPAGVRTSDIEPFWIQWRCDQINRLVQRVSEQVRAVRPDCRISAAVFANYPACRVTNGQDWVYWARQGWVDFLCPMNYTESDTAFAARVTEQLHLIEGRVPLYPGIGVVSSASTLSADRVAGQIALTRHLGADGFTIFDYSSRITSDILPPLGEGLLHKPALIPETGPRYDFDLGPLTREATYGRHMAIGSALEFSVHRTPDPKGREFADIQAFLVLESADGTTIQELDVIPADGTLDLVITPPGSGLYRLRVQGSYSTESGDRKAFSARSAPIVVGDLPEDILALL
ncbi:MAG: glycoside hydrolase family 10 protein [Limnochordia bacterium]|jgi:uncharacterized lipoprotein YddW (UPF0748 family)